ncbi:unnamed protein product [Ectocarpus sp. 6 AP-2014]
MAGRNSGGRSTTSSHPSVVSYGREVSIVERCWEVLPTGSKPKAGLVLIHGGNWHSGWFGELGDLLSSAEYSIRVSAPDLISHGLSDDPVPGYRAYCPDFASQAEEVGAAIARARAALPEGCPLFVLGESMGGLCALQHLISEKANDGTTDTVDGVILCGALLQIAPGLLPPKAVFPLLQAVGWLIPSLGVPGAAIGGETFDTAFGDPAVGPAARADPLVTEMAPPRLGMMLGFLKAMDVTKREGPVKLKVKSVLMMHYKGDQRTLYEDCQRFVDDLPMEDKVCIPLEGDSHQIFQDTPEKSKKHIETVARFITERAG